MGGKTVTVNVNVGGKNIPIELPQNTTINGQPIQKLLKGSLLNVPKEQAIALLGLAQTDNNKKTADANDTKNSKLLERSVNSQLEKYGSKYRVGEVINFEGVESGIFNVKPGHVFINMTPNGKTAYENNAKTINIDFTR